MSIESGIAPTESKETSAVDSGQGRVANSTRSWLVLGPILLIAAIVIVIDQLVKWWILNTLGGPNGEYIREIIPGIFQLRYVENTGAAFSLFRDASWVLAGVATIVSIAIIYYAPRIHQEVGAGKLRLYGLFGMALVLGGALGNLIDRIRFGFVVDFVEVSALAINIGDRRYQFPVFNVADSAITVGIIILLISLLFSKPENKTNT